jgi:hypothetical protein
MEQNQNVAIIDHDSQSQVTDLAQNVARLAVQLDYNGTVNVGALEDEIRFYQQRSVEACLELGKRLLILKEITPHGEFTQRIELLGFSDRMARKFMSATLKFSNRNSNSVLKSAGTQTKLLELVTLDDDDIAELEAGGTVAGLNLDAIETMSVRELKKALREAKADNTSKDQLIESKNNKIDDLATKLNRRRAPEQAALVEQEAEQEALVLMQTATSEFIAAVSKYNADMNAATEISSSPYVAEQYQANVVMTYQRIADQSTALGVHVDFQEMVSPAWVANQTSEEAH